MSEETLLEIRQYSGSHYSGTRKMFLDKVWLRIKGELLVLRENLTRKDDQREKAEGLPEKLEQLLNRTGFKTDSPPDVKPRLKGVEESIEQTTDTALRTTGGRGETRETPQRSLAELERILDEAARLPDGKSEEPHDAETPPPNPRKLG